MALLRLNTVAVSRASMVMRGERQRGAWRHMRLAGADWEDVEGEQTKETQWNVAALLAVIANWSTAEHTQWSDSDSDNSTQTTDLRSHTHTHTLLTWFPPCSQKTRFCLQRYNPAVYSNTVWWRGKHSWEDARFGKGPGTVLNMHNSHCKTKEHFKDTANKECDFTKKILGWLQWLFPAIIIPCLKRGRSTQLLRTMFVTNSKGGVLSHIFKA